MRERCRLSQLHAHWNARSLTRLAVYWLCTNTHTLSNHNPFKERFRKVTSSRRTCILFSLPNEDAWKDWQFYPSQTKRNKRWNPDFRSTRFGLRTIEKYIESLHCINCSSFQNLRLGQPSATSPLFFDNLHFEHVDKRVNLDSWLTFLSTWFKMEIVEKKGTSCRRLFGSINLQWQKMKSWFRRKHF